MPNDVLIDFLRAKGYSTAEIAAVTCSLREINNIRAAADRERMAEIKTPIQACALSAKHQQLWRQTTSMIRTASAMRFSPDEGKPIDVAALNAAIRDSSIENRMAIKSNLRLLNLIPA